MGLEACVGTKKELEQGEIRGGSGGQLGPLQAPVLHSLQRPVLYGATSRYRVNRAAATVYPASVFVGLYQVQSL